MLIDFDLITIIIGVESYHDHSVWNRYAICIKNKQSDEKRIIRSRIRDMY